MDWYLGFIFGVLAGILCAVIFELLRKKDVAAITENLVNQTKDSFNSAAFQTLSSSTTQLQAFANQDLAAKGESVKQELETKKQLIDQSLFEIKDVLEKTTKFVMDYDSKSSTKFTTLETELKNASTVTSKLQETADELKEALHNSRIRGQWGERMAEDILRLVGFQENVNYFKQKQLDESRSRPDFTFLLPKDLKVNMDVKFPFDNYLRYLESNDGEGDQYKTQFLDDVRHRIKEVTTRDYINPNEKTLEFVLLFIPNEHVFTFINENDDELIEESLRNKVIICSPLTLYSILVIIRQAIDNFNLERNISEVLSLFGGFSKQWEKFIESFNKMGKKLSEAQTEFNALTSTRRNKVDVQLRKIDALRAEKGLPMQGADRIDQEDV